MSEPLEILSEVERRTLDEYVALLRERLGDNLVPREPLDPALQQELDATHPLFLQSGHQLGPQFRTATQHLASPSREGIDRDAVGLTLT